MSKKYLSTADRIDAIKFGIQLTVFCVMLALVVYGGYLAFTFFDTKPIGS